MPVHHTARMTVRPQEWSNRQRLRVTLSKNHRLGMSSSSQAVWGGMLDDGTKISKAGRTLLLGRHALLPSGDGHGQPEVCSQLKNTPFVLLPCQAPGFSGLAYCLESLALHSNNHKKQKTMMLNSLSF